MIVHERREDCGVASGRSTSEHVTHGLGKNLDAAGMNCDVPKSPPGSAVVCATRPAPGAAGNMRPPPKPVVNQDTTL